MMQFLIAAPRSGSGKTTVTCAVLTALQRRGADPCAFKCGPDYIDPMFHRSALGVESHNLDLYLSAPDTVRTLYARDVYKRQPGSWRRWERRFWSVLPPRWVQRNRAKQTASPCTAGG